MSSRCEAAATWKAGYPVVRCRLHDGHYGPHRGEKRGPGPFLFGPAEGPPLGELVWDTPPTTEQQRRHTLDEAYARLGRAQFAYENASKGPLKAINAEYDAALDALRQLIEEVGDGK